MSKLEKTIVENEITYNLGADELYYPALEIPEVTHYDIGKFGRMRGKFLKEYRHSEYMTEILRQYFINHPQSIDKYTFLQNSAFTHWVKEKCSKMC